MGNKNFDSLPTDIFFIEINKQIRYTEACAEIFSLLAYTNPKYENEKWNPVLATAPTFFKVIRKALLEMTLLNLSGICESYKKTADFIDSQNDFLNTEDKIKHYQLCKAKMKEGAKLLSGIDTIRDKTIAHFDPDYFENTSDLYNEVELKIENIRKLISILKEISNDLTKLIFNNTEEVYFESYNFGDVAQLMEICLSK